MRSLATELHKITQKSSSFVSCILYFASCVLCLTFPVYADLEMQVLPGFDGYHKHGRWLSLRVILSSANADITGEITVEQQDSTTGDRQIYSSPITLFRAARKTQYLYALPKSFRRNLQVKLTDSQGKAVAQKYAPMVAMSPEDLLIVAIARTGSGLEYVPNAPGRDNKSRKIYVSYSTAKPLPDKWKGYDSVDMIVLGDISVNTLSNYQQKAITDWVRSGGRLIVSGGAHSQNLMGTFVEELLPVRISGTRVLDSISSLSLEFRRHIGGAQMMVAASELTDGGKVVLAEEDGLPIIAEKQVGNGKVIFLAFDYLDPTFRAWNGKEEMWETLFPQSAARLRSKDADIARLLTANRSARLPSYKLVGVFLLLYVLCFGPLNYIILKKSRKSHLTWITMPIISAAFIIGSLTLAHAMKNQTTIVNDLSVVNIYQNAGRVRMSNYFSLLSPAKHDYKMEFPASDGMFANRMPSSLHHAGDCRIVEKETFQIEILNMDALASQLFYGESYADLNGSVSTDLVKSHDGIIEGEVVNNFPFDFTDCYVFSKGRRSHIGDLASGDRMQVRLDQACAENAYDLYFERNGKKHRFISAIEPGLARRIPDTGLIGLIEGSALKIFAGMKMGEEYKSSGMALVIVHL